MIHDSNVPALTRKISDMVAEYDAKKEAIPAAIADYSAATDAIKSAACVAGAYGGDIFGRYQSIPSARDMESALLASAWKAAIEALGVREIATAKDLAKLETSLTNPPDFTIDTVRATFGTYLADSRFHVLRGIAEAFADLDDSYKSHSKVKIGVKGLPKRLIITGALASYGGWREGQLKDLLNAMATLHNEPRLDYSELEALKDAARRGDDPQIYGMTLRGFANGNAHVIFDPESLRVINLALAEFYGDVLPDVEPDNATRAASTAVSADLAYYPTPAGAAAELVKGVYIQKGETVLEPSCGCGRLLDLIRDSGGRATGIEYHAGRAQESRDKGHHVQTANFLQVAPQAIFDHVVMNPPFAGKHYAKHIEHALKFLKPGGTLSAILPASAWYDHKELPPGGSWRDLPPGSFHESGTNVPTGIYRTSAPGRRVP